MYPFAYRAFLCSVCSWPPRPALVKSLLEEENRVWERQIRGKALEARWKNLGKGTFILSIERRWQPAESHEVCWVENYTQSLGLTHWGAFGDILIEVLGKMWGWKPLRT